MRSRMTDEQLAKLKGKAASATDTRRLAQAANGFGVSRADAEKARKALSEELGERGAKKAREAEIRSAGGRAKGLGRFFG